MVRIASWEPIPSFLDPYTAEICSQQKGKWQSIIRFSDFLTKRYRDTPSPIGKIVHNTLPLLAAAIGTASVEYFSSGTDTTSVLTKSLPFVVNIFVVAVHYALYCHSIYSENKKHSEENKAHELQNKIIRAYEEGAILETYLERSEYLSIFLDDSEDSIKEDRTYLCSQPFHLKPKNIRVTEGGKEYYLDFKNGINTDIEADSSKFPARQTYSLTLYQLFGYPITVFLPILQNIGPEKYKLYISVLSNMLVGIVEGIKKYREAHPPEKTEAEIRYANIAHILESYANATQEFKEELHEKLPIKTWVNGKYVWKAPTPKNEDDICYMSPPPWQPVPRKIQDYYSKFS
jgi:hypothetical protein